MSEFKASKVKFFGSLPPVPKKKKSTILIYDKILEKHFPKWIQQFPLRYGVKSGEGLKDIKKLPKHLSEIIKRVEPVGRAELEVYALGGGSVGDFAGFVASILYRGVHLVQIPTTWLAAVDSAHGGKTALNVDHYKNQVGTFYPAKEIWISKTFLLNQPDARAREAFGEIVKIGLLEGGNLWKQLLEIRSSGESMWQILPRAIQAKWKVVMKDPHEQRGQRLILNLGHTLGHVFESKLKVPHGQAVALGLQFALNWSKNRGDLPVQVLKQLVKWQKERSWPSNDEVSKALSKIKDPAVALKKDKKKLTANKIKFIFSKGPGLTKIQDVSIQEILQEIQRQVRKS